MSVQRHGGQSTAHEQVRAAAFRRPATSSPPLLPPIDRQTLVAPCSGCRSATSRAGDERPSKHVLLVLHHPGAVPALAELIAAASGWRTQNTPAVFKPRPGRGWSKSRRPGYTSENPAVAVKDRRVVAVERQGPPFYCGDEHRHPGRAGPFEVDEHLPSSRISAESNFTAGRRKKKRTKKKQFRAYCSLKVVAVDRRRNDVRGEGEGTSAYALRSPDAPETGAIASASSTCPDGLARSCRTPAIKLVASAGGGRHRGQEPGY
jgi:hypothetical protein